MKNKLEGIDTFLRAAIFGASLASPIIGAGVGLFMGGLLGAVAGLVVGPVAAVGVISTFYAAGVAINGIKKMTADHKSGKPLKLKQRFSSKNLRRAGRTVSAALVRGVGWALNMAVGVCTLGKGRVNLHGLADRIEKKGRECGNVTRSDTVPSPVADTSSNTSRFVSKRIGDAFEGAKKHEIPKEKKGTPPGHGRKRPHTP